MEITKDQIMDKRATQYLVKFPDGAEKWVYDNEVVKDE